MRRRVVAPGLALACWVGLAFCDGGTSRPSKAPESPSPASPSAGTETPRPPQPAALPSADTVPLGAHRASELVEAATEILGFLRGEVDFDRIRLADTVTLYLAPEAGGARRKVSREPLRDPSNWNVRTADMSHARGMAYSFVPTKGAAELTTRVGRHFRCRDYPLSSIFPELARLPHVGTRLTYGTDSCLQTRNLTLVFDPKQKPPTLIAAVYDQWEW
jgi:hypothetical protein